MKKILTVIMILLCLPIMVFAEGKSIVTDGNNVADSTCYLGVCYNEDNNLITLDNSNSLVHSYNFDELNVEIIHDVVMDFSTAGDSYLYYDAKADAYNIHLNRNSTLTIKNLNEEYIFNNVSKLNVTGEENSKIIFENCKHGINVNGGTISINGVTIEGKTTIDYVLHAELDNPRSTVLLKNVNIFAPQSARVDNITELYDRAIIGVNNGNLKIENSNIESKAYGFYKEIHRASDEGIYATGNIEIVNSNITLENYSAAINSEGDVTIKNANIKITNCGVGIEGNNVTFISGTYINKYTLEDTDYIDIPTVKYGLGFASTGKIDIQNGYLEFSGRVTPIALMDYNEEVGINISEVLSSNKDYNTTKYTVSVSDISIYFLTKEGIPSEKTIIVDDEMISSDQNIYDLFYDDLLTNVTFTGRKFVRLDSNNNSGSIYDLEINYSKNTLPENKFTPLDNKKFKGWSLTPNGEIITTLGNDDEVTLYAIWEDEVVSEPGKENPNTGVYISIPVLIGLIALGSIGIKITNRKNKFN